MSSNRETNLLRACCGRALQQGVWLLLLFVSLRGALAAAADRPPVDLDGFDARKQSVALPNCATLAYVQLGKSGGVPVVLIHGYTDSASDWLPLLPYLSPGLRLIVPDLRGHGRSSAPECCYTRLDFAYDIKLLLDALGVAQADLVGHSLGSIVVQAFAEHWPERTRRVVLVSSTGGPRPGAPANRVLSDFEAQIASLQDPIDANSPFMIAWWASPTTVDEEFVRRKRVESAAIPARVWHAVLEQEVEPMLAGSDLQRTLPRLSAPALLIWGEKDPIIDEGMRQTLRAALPRAQVKVFAGLGHNPLWEDPAGVGEVINAFLSAAPAATTAPAGTAHPN